MNELKQKFIVENNNFESIGAIICYPRFLWTTNCLIEQISYKLINTTEKDGITRKYVKRAKWFLRRINIYDPPPEFIIYRNDLSKRVYQELVRLKKESPQHLNYVITSSLECLFECIEEKDELVFNKDYFLLSVKPSKLFRWRFDRREDHTIDPDLKYNINYDCYSTDGEYLEKNTKSQYIDRKEKIGV